MTFVRRNVSITKRPTFVTIYSNEGSKHVGVYFVISLRSTASDNPTKSLSASFAMRKSVAFGVKANDFETHSFISISIASPILRLTEN